MTCKYVTAIRKRSILTFYYTKNYINKTIIILKISKNHKINLSLRYLFPFKIII